MNGVSLMLGLPAIGVAIGLFVYALVAGKSTAPAGAAEASKASRLRLRGAARSSGPFVEEPTEPQSILIKFGKLAAKVTPSDYTQRIQRRLDLAGNPGAWIPERMLAFKGFGLAIGGVLGFAVGAKHTLVLGVLLAALMGAAGLFLPDLIVRNIGEKRQITLQKQLPDAMDMLMVCVEAGMGFDSALARVARNSTGPVSEEFARVLQEMQVGKSRTEALRALVARTDVAELRAFVSSMVQSAELGISIGDVLREQAKEMRIKRRQRAQERAQKLQVKLLMPLITCLLPAMFVVILGPAIINIAHFFSSAGH